MTTRGLLTGKERMEIRHRQELEEARAEQLAIEAQEREEMERLMRDLHAEEDANAERLAFASTYPAPNDFTEESRAEVEAELEEHAHHLRMEEEGRWGI